MALPCRYYSPHILPCQSASFLCSARVTGLEGLNSEVYSEERKRERHASQISKELCNGFGNRSGNMEWFGSRQSAWCQRSHSSRCHRNGRACARPFGRPQTTTRERACRSL